jgi:hypothetical protein
VTHIVDQVLEQFRQRLYDAATLARNNVEVDRDWPVAPEEEPFDWLLINEGADSVKESSVMRPRRLTEEMEVKVRVVSRANPGEGTSKARCRKMMLQVQLALLGPAADITLGASPSSCAMRAASPSRMTRPRTWPRAS